MKILIAIPSKKRAEILKKNALSWVTLTGMDYKIFIEAEDCIDYTRTLKEEEKIWILPEDNRGLGYSKTIIKQYAERNGYDLIFKIDDDVSGWTDFRTKLNPEQSAERFKSIVLECVHLFENHKDVAVISFPYAFQMFEQVQFKKTKRVQTAYICRTEDFHADENISVFEDFAVGLKVVTSNKLVMIYGMSGIQMGVKVGGGTGGHQSFDREAQALKEIELLRKIYPPLAFRMVDKIWKYEPDMRSIKFGYYK